MSIQKMNKRKKPLKEILGGLLAAFVILMSAASCNSGGEEGATEEGVAETEEVGYGAETEEGENKLASSDEVGDYNEWDTNDDQQWDENEFETVANDSGFYEEWDADADGYLSDDELYGGTYGVYDEDDDGTFTNEEFDVWNTAWGGAYDYNEWDTNNDNVLDEEEYDAGTEGAGIYDDWDEDADGLYSEDEVYGGLNETWDADDDNYLAEEEYNSIGYNLWGF